MKKIILLIALGIFIVSCGGKKEGAKDSLDVNGVKTADKKEESAGVPIDLDNKGIGPIKNVDFASEVDTEMAALGESKFNGACTACHMIEGRMIGPGIKGIYERRSPEWVMNMILNPSEMLQKDPIAKALLKEYNNAMMIANNLSEEEVRAIAEYFRTL